MKKKAKINPKFSEPITESVQPQVEAHLQSDPGEVEPSPIKNGLKGLLSSEGLSQIARSVEAIHGEESMIYLGDHPDYGSVKNWISTQNFALDWIISGKADGSGGLPSGRIVEFFGDPSSGKSLLLAHVLAEVQKRGGIVALVDAESTFDWNFAKAIGLEPENLLYSTAYTKEKRKVKIPDEAGKMEEVEIDSIISASVERVTKIIEDLIDVVRYKYPDLLFVIGLDSVAVLTTEHEIDAPDKRDLTKAKAIRTFVRKLEGKLSKLDVMLICTNHTIANIDMNPFVRKVGPKELKSTPGGSGLPFGTSLRLDLARGKDIKEASHGAEVVIGHEIWAFTHKSKVFPARKRIVIEMKYDKGIDPYSGLLDIMALKGIVEEMGEKVYRYKGERFKERRMNKYKGFDEIIIKYPELLADLASTV